MNAGERTALPKDMEVVFKWVPVKGVRLSVAANKAVYEEYKEVRAQLLKDTVYNPDGTENKEGISRLRQAGLSDKAIYEVIGNGRTPNGYNYHHLFPRAASVWKRRWKSSPKSKNVSAVRRREQSRVRRI